MIRDSYQQFVIVQADSAQQLTAQVNEELMRLRRKNPHVEFEGLIARISYSEDFIAPEELCDEYELIGVRLTCQDCPYFIPKKKTDGTPDLRAKVGDCPHKAFGATMGRTSRDNKACETLYEAINSGEVRLCLAD